MTQDAKFEDGREAPLNLGVEDAEDLKIVSSLCQDAILPITEMRWERRKRRFTLLLNRFRWEDRGGARHGAERVRALLSFEDVLNVAGQGIDQSANETILSLLSIEFEAGEDGAGEILLTFAGDGAIRMSVEAIAARLQDVTRPYDAPSGQVPDHGEI